MTSPTRRCKNWLQTYRDFILPRTDAPESFVFWSGIFTLSAAIRRRVHIPKKYLGLWKCYPHMYLMFVGPPGMRKTTAIDNGARELLKQVDGLKEGPDFFTKEVVLDRMQQSHDAAVYMSIDEFSSIFQKAAKDADSIYEFFTAMYDSKAAIESATKSSGTVFLENPCINFFSATTPGWIANKMPESVINGGFASRCIWVYEEKLRINKMFFHDVTHPYPEDKSITFDQLEADLLLDLMTIGQLEGEFSFDDAGLKYASEWGEENAPMELLKNDKLGGYLNRRKMHVAKLAMIHSIMTKDELVITEEDWRFGVWSIGTIEPNLSKVFGGVGKNKYTTEIDKIVTFVKNMNFFTEKVVPRSEILVNFQHSAEPRALNDLIGFAVDSKLLMCKEKWVKGEKDYDFWVPEFTPREETV